MDARIQDLPFDPTTLKGLSEKLLRSHHQNNYSGPVKRLNAIRAQLGGLAFATAPGFQPGAGQGGRPSGRSSGDWPCATAS